MEQGTEEWKAARRGKLTASRLADALATLREGGEYIVEPRGPQKFAVILKGAKRATKILTTEDAAKKYAAKCSQPEWGSTRAKYQTQLVLERLTGRTEDGYTNAAMRRGTEMEPEAREAYSLIHMVEVEQVGFVDHPTIAMAGASPDGRVDTAGMVEIKCPDSSTHLDTWLGAPIPDKYILQMQWQMECDGREWCDWVSYDDRMPAHLRLFVKRIHRDEKRLAIIRPQVEDFLGEVAEKVEKLQKYGEAA